MALLQNHVQIKQDTLLLLYQDVMITYVSKKLAGVLAELYLLLGFSHICHKHMLQLI